MGYECSEYIYPHLNIHNSSTCPHVSEEENRTIAINTAIALSLNPSLTISLLHYFALQIVCYLHRVFAPLDSAFSLTGDPYLKPDRGRRKLAAAILELPRSEKILMFYY
jgi:hypothetical protein